MRPRDFLADDPELNPQAEYKPAPRDFLAEDMEFNPQENIGESVLKAPYRVSEDLIRGGVGLAKKIPEYYKSAKTEIPELLKTISPVLAKNMIPGSALIYPNLERQRNTLNQGLAGFAEAGRNIFNTPHDLVNYLATRLNLFPKDINEKIQMARMPNDTQQMINQTFGEPQQPGEALMRGLGRNAINALGIGGIAKTLNPLQMSAKNIAQDVLRTREAMRQKYSGPKGLYTNLFNEARNQGLGQVKYEPKKINLDLINEYAPDKYTKALDEFVKNPDIEIAQKAQSDLKKYLNKMERRDSIPSPEKKSIEAARIAQEHLSDAMFKGNPKLKRKYDVITKGYGEEVIPYTTHKGINDYRKGELVAEELLPKLQRGKFRAKRGKSHPAIKWRKRSIYTGAGTGAGVGGSWLYNYLSGGSSNPFSNQ